VWPFCSLDEHFRAETTRGAVSLLLFSKAFAARTLDGCTGRQLRGNSLKTSVILASICQNNATLNFGLYLQYIQSSAALLPRFVQDSNSRFAPRQRPPFIPVKCLYPFCLLQHDHCEFSRPLIGGIEESLDEGLRSLNLRRVQIADRELSTRLSPALIAIHRSECVG
jgi:hypothetical protein